MSSAERPPLADQAERARIAGELDRSLLVEAGAGSGKTHELASRMAAGIASGIYQVEHMAAVTFTRKAAAELRGRFQEALEDRLENPNVGRTFRSGDEDRIHRALSSLERFFAGTIHSFCARLLRERPVEAGVAPGFTELDDAQDRLLREQSWRDFRSQAIADGDPDFLLLDECGIRPKELDKAFEVVCLYEEVDFPAGDAAMPDATRAWKALDAFWTELCRHLPRPVHQDTTCGTQQKAERFKRDWDFHSRTKGAAARTPAVLASLLAHWDFNPKIVQKWWSEDGAEKKRLAQLVPELHQAFRDSTVAPFLTAWRQYVYGVSVRVLVKARDRTAEERRRHNVLSFNDLLLRTAEVLRTNADVRRAMQRKYRWLFVDEFQDTDPIQAEIMFLLAGDDEGQSETADWRTMPIRPGALFVVGDPKQSIYRFRRADIDIYNQVRARLAGDDGRGIVTLTTNFRSSPDLCEWANRVFDGPFPKEATEHTPKFAPLVSVGGGRGFPPSASLRRTRRSLGEGGQTRGDQTRGDTPRGLFTLTLPPDTDDGIGDEAARIARFVRSEVDAGRRGYGDFLVLTRKKKRLQRYADALEALLVPVEVSGGSGFSQSPEVQQLALLLMALTDPQDQVALVGVLRGALFGLSDRDLFAWRQAGGWLSLFAPSVEAGPLGPAITPNPNPAITNVSTAIARLRLWHKWTRMLPAGAALERILEDSGYLALAASSPDGVDAGDLLHAVDRVRAVVETGFTLAEAAEALASWSELDEDGPEESTELESLPLESGRRDVVRVMNLHKAKGLEAPVVVLADPTGGLEPRVDVRIVRGSSPSDPPRGYFQIVPDGGWGRKPIAEPADWDRLQAEELLYLEAEDTRLLYVAATRARDTLVVSRWAKGGKNKQAWALLDAHLADAAELEVPDDVTLPEHAAVDLGAAAVARAARVAENAHGAAMKASWSATSVTAETKRFPAITPAGGDDGLSEKDDPTRTMVEDTPSRRADAGVAWGTLVHGLLEHAMRHPSATRDDLHRLAMWLTLEEPQLRTVIDLALDTVESVKTAEFWQEARAAEECHEEVPFAVRRTDNGRPVVVSGTIDLVHRVGEGWRVVDYKTDVEGDKPGLERRYSNQMFAYVDAWRHVTRAEVDATIAMARAKDASTDSTSIERGEQ